MTSGIAGITSYVFRRGCALLLCWLALSVRTDCGELSVLPQDDRHVDLIYEAGAIEKTELLIDGVEYTQIDVEGCFSSGKPGDPALARRELTVGIPLDAVPTVEVLSVETKALRNVLLAPIPGFQFDSLGVSRYVYEPDPFSYARRGFEPATFAQMSGTGLLRNQRVAHITLSAVRFDAAGRVAEVCERIRLRVRFNRTGRGAGASLPGDGFERLYQSAIVNYSQSKIWRRTPGRTVGEPGSQPWLKISLTDEGIYALTYDELRNAGVPVDVVDPRTFLLLNGGSKPLPEDLSEPRPAPIQVPIYVEGEEDGRMDPSEYILFYAVSLTGWSLDTTADSFAHFLNPYAATNVYWLTWGGESGLRMDTLDVYPADPSPIRPLAFEDRIHLEEELESPLRSGLRWIWHRLRREPGQDRASFTTQVYPKGVASGTCEVRMAFFVESDTVVNLRLYLNGEAVVDQPGPGQSGKFDPPRMAGGTAHSLVSGRNDIKVELTGGVGDSLESMFIDFFELTYDRGFGLGDGKLKFSTGTSPVTGIHEYNLGNAGDAAAILNVTDPFKPVRLINWLRGASEVTFQFDVNKTEVYSAAGTFLKPSRLELDTPYNLRSGGADYLAICYEPFMAAVGDLLSWRNSYISGIPSPKAMIVEITDVLDNFSWGVVDPTAIRDFLAWTYWNWNPAPSYCVLVGASTYDYKNNLKLAHPKNFIPPHVEGYVVVSGNKFPEEENYCYDDWFAWLTAGDTDPDIYLGRLDAISTEEARILASRAVNYEREKLLGVWLKRCLLVADDQDTYSGDAQFTRQCEQVAKIVPADIDLLKVYMVEYPKVGEDKPGARDAKIECINKGVLSGVFLGHGNIKQLAHEKVFRSPEDVDRLRNGRKVPFFYYGSCSVGLLDRPTASSMGSLTSKGAYGGHIVSLAASRPTFGGPNADYAYELFGNIYNNDSLKTAGEIVYDAKVRSRASRTSLYILYGDPGVRLVPPALHCSLEVIPDSMIGLSRVKVQGVVDDSTFEGWAMVRAFDSAHMESDTSEKWGSVVDYELPGEPFYWGLAFVKNGRFTHSFTVPKIEAGSIREGVDGRVSVYVWDDRRDGSGAVDSLYVGGNSGPVTDRTGPTIRIQYEGMDVTDSVFIRVGSKITGVVSDESGIYLGNRPDRVLRMVINGDELNSLHLNELFNYDQGTDTLGRFTCTLELPEGDSRDSLTFVASDNSLNRSEVSIIARPIGPEDVEISDVLNYPNPFEKDTYFTFWINQPADVTVKVYTVGGRLIKTLARNSCSSGYNQVYWNGLDEDGDRPANGVYLYKVVAQTYGYSHEVVAGSRVEVIGKLLVVR
ncbi:MAG: C25 family cysteine peptidase [bacterium]